MQPLLVILHNHEPKEGACFQNNFIMSLIYFIITSIYKRGFTEFEIEKNRKNILHLIFLN